MAQSSSSLAPAAASAQLQPGRPTPQAPISSLPGAGKKGSPPSPASFVPARPDRCPLAIPTDVTDPTDLEVLVGRTLDIYGRIDVLVNNAGQGFYSPVAEADMDLYRRILEVNLLGPLAAMQAVLPPCGTVAEE